MVKSSLFAKNSFEPIQITKNNPPRFVKIVLRHHFTAKIQIIERKKCNFCSFCRACFACMDSRAPCHINESNKSSSHYLSDKNRLNVSSKGPLSGISVGGWRKHTCFYTSEYIKTACDKIKTNQMDLIKTRNK